MSYDIIDEWVQVQRKWMYLEGIFIGGDIRTQLPDEAKKFDDIDKAYKRVSILSNPIRYSHVTYDDSESICQRMVVRGFLLLTAIFFDLLKLNFYGMCEIDLISLRDLRVLGFG